MAIRLGIGKGIKFTHEMIRRMCVLLCEELRIEHDFDDLASLQWFHQFLKRRPFLYCGNTFF